MSTGIIVPTAKPLTICDYVIGVVGQKPDVYGVFNAIQPNVGYPHRHDEFCVFTQLSGGLGRVSWHIDIVDASTNRVVRVTNVRHINFPGRESVQQLAVTIQNCLFPHSGVYLVELFCENQWVGDVPLLLH